MGFLPKIKVFGVGNAGCRIIERLLQKNYFSVEYYALDDDCNTLRLSNCKNKIQITGVNHKGADYAYSQNVTLKYKDLIVNAINGADLILIAAGMGGGMGSAATPIIAEIAKENNVISVAVVYTPFKFEGDKRLFNTETGLRALKDKANMTIVIPCEKAKSCISEATSITEAMKLADEMAMDAMNTIIAPITIPGVLNLDYEDMLLALKQSRTTFFGSGTGKGKDKITEATKNAMNCPMATTTIENASSMIIYVEGGDDLTLDELHKIATYVNTVTNGKVNVLFAVNNDSKPTGELKVSILASKNDN